jgi:hypothetical protein
MHSIRRRFLMMAMIVAACGDGLMAAPSINYPNFLFNAPYQDNGNAYGVNFSTLLMTANGNQNSSTFVIAPQDLTQSFSAAYSFYMGSGYFNGIATDGTGPGGFTFVIQGDSRGAAAIGGGGSQLGYGDGVNNTNLAIQHGVALTYSTFAGSDQFQLFTNNNNANLNTLSGALATQTGSENLSGLLSQMTVNYQAPDLSYPNGALTVLLNGNSIGLDNIALPASIASLAGSSTGLFGFSASTGGVTGTNLVTGSGPEMYVGSLVVGAPVPEPACISVIGLAAIGLLGRRRR